MKKPSLALSKKFVVPIISGVVILLCLVVFLFRFSEVGTLKEATADADMTVRKMQRNIQNSENLEAQLGEIEEITDQISKRTIAPGDTAVNTAYFYQFESEGLNIESVQQGTGPSTSEKSPWKMKNFESTLFSIKATGKFQKLMDFAFRIRAGEKVVRVVELSVTPASRNASDERRIELTLEALTQIPKKE